MIEGIHSRIRYLGRKGKPKKHKRGSRRIQKEYQQDMEDIRQQEREKETFRRGELPE